MLETAENPRGGCSEGWEERKVKVCVEKQLCACLGADTPLLADPHPKHTHDEGQLCMSPVLSCKS